MGGQVCFYYSSQSVLSRFYLDGGVFTVRNVLFLFRVFDRVRSFQLVFCTHPVQFFHSPQSAVHSPQSAVRSPQSAVRSPQLMFSCWNVSLPSPPSTTTRKGPVKESTLWNALQKQLFSRSSVTETRVQRKNGNRNCSFHSDRYQ